MFPWQRYIPAWMHDVISHSSVAKQQQSILCMVLYIAYSDTEQFTACMCQISLVYVSLRKRYESTLIYFWLTLVNSIFGLFMESWTHWVSCKINEKPWSPSRNHEHIGSLAKFTRDLICSWFHEQTKNGIHFLNASLWQALASFL